MDRFPQNTPQKIEQEENKIEKPNFGVKSKTEQKPFENPAVESFFTKWCEINDSIVPKIISRSEWDEKEEKGFFEKDTDGKQILYIPKDLQLWEMIKVIEVVDADTFKNNPEQANKAKEKILKLGATFQNAGVYINQRLDSIKQGKEIAAALSQEFYNYGQSLSNGKKSNESDLSDGIPSKNLSEDELEEVDRFLAGDTLYKTRQAKVEKKLLEEGLDNTEEQYEDERRKTLSQFFSVSATAFELSKPSPKKEESSLKKWFKGKMELLTKSSKIAKEKTASWYKLQELLQKNKLSQEEMQEKERLENIVFTLRPWKSQTTTHEAFLSKVERNIKQEIETPKTELTGSLFRRGMEFLRKNMPFDSLPEGIQKEFLALDSGEKTLREALQIDKCKAELEEVRKFGDRKLISYKEQEITDKIQKVIRAFPYKPRATNPSEIAVDQNINCLGASILGGSLMSEAGLKYLVGGLPGHALLFLVTTDGQVEWRDMQNLDTFFLSNQAIHGKNKNNADLAIEDIVDFEKNPTMEGLQFGIRTRDAAIGKKQEILVRMWGPEHGQKIQLLNNVGAILHDLGRYQEAIEAYNAVITTNPNWSMVYHNLGGALRKLNRNEEAIEAYRKAIENDPSSPRTGEYFLDLGKALSSLGRKDEAMEAYVQCTNLYSGDIADVAWAKIKELKNKQTF